MQIIYNQVSIDGFGAPWGGCSGQITECTFATNRPITPSAFIVRRMLRGGVRRMSFEGSAESSARDPAGTDSSPYAEGRSTADEF